jgi:DivIVA domain-containing protein
MSLTPEDVEKQVFKERFRGYDQDEVDRFLDRVAASVGEFIRERDLLRDRVRELERQAAESSESGELLQRTLVAAQRTADETIDEARATAEQTVEDARHQAEEILAQARNEAEETVAAAHQRSGENERQAHEALDHVRRVVEDLSRFRSEYRERVEAVIAEQLALLDRAGELPELPEGLRSLEERAAPDIGGGEPGSTGQVFWENEPQG